MQIQTLEQYKLLQADVPEIQNKKLVIKDVGVGGVKLRYKISTVKALVFNLFGKQKIIPIFKLSYPSSEIKTFLRPYKDIWDTSRNKLPRCLWGNKNEPLTNLWIELKLDYKSLKTGRAIPKQEIRNTNITKHLTRIHKVFYVELKKNQLLII